MFKKITILVGLLCVILVIGALFFARDFEVPLSETLIQSKIDEQIAVGPISKKGIELTIKSATIDFRNDDTAQVSVDFEAKGFGYSGGLTGDFSAGLTYKQPEIFLANLQTTNIETQFDTKTAEKIDEVKNMALDFLKKQKKESLNDKALESLDNIISSNEEELKELAISTSYRFLETMPLYDLNDAGFKGSVASLALKDVEFTDSHAVITLSPKQAVIKILSFLLAILLGGLVIAFFILRTYGRDENDGS